MNIGKQSIKSFITKQSDYFKIPEFQRPYTWERESLRQFFSDLDAATKSNKVHFFGSIVHIREQKFNSIIDGQQRLTTTYLFLCAIYHTLKAREKAGNTARLTAEQIKDLYLYDKYGYDHQYRNIVLKTVTTDDNVFSAILNNPNSLTPEQKANKQYKAYKFFHDECLSNRNDIENLVNALDKFEIISVVLDNNDDNPQLIFESINTTGKPLESGDKIRNYALMLNTDDLRDYVYKTYWATIEKKLLYYEKNTEISDISRFFRYFLQCKEGEFIAEADIYSKFKERYNAVVSIDTADDFYKEALLYLDAFVFLTRLESKGTKLDQQTKFYRQFNYLMFKYLYFDSEIYLSFFMDLLVDFFQNKNELEEVYKIAKLYECYFIRKIIVSGSFGGGTNKEICKWYKKLQQLKKENSTKTENDIFANILLSLGGRVIITNNEVLKKALSNNPVGTYTLKYVYYILTSIEEMQEDVGDLLRGIAEKKNSLSLEHIMPQTITNDWQQELGNDWQRVHNEYLNNIGNLTLTAYNTKYSNKSFKFKKECDNGFNSSNLNINSYIKKVTNWNEQAIINRREIMIESLINCFPMPITSIEIAKPDNIFTLEELDKKDNKGFKPCRIVIENEDDLYVDSWRDCIIQVLLYCYSMDKEKFINICQEASIGGRKNALIGTSKNKAATAERLMDGEDIFYHNNLNANQTASYILQIATQFNLNDKILIELIRVS